MRSERAQRTALTNCASSQGSEELPEVDLEKGATPVLKLLACSGTDSRCRKMSPRWAITSQKALLRGRSVADAHDVVKALLASQFIRNRPRRAISGHVRQYQPLANVEFIGVTNLICQTGHRGK